MTIAATLSRKLYETFGDEAAGAMVDWMHRMDTQRSELRELNDLSFARVDSRFSEFSARMDMRFAAVDAGFAEVNATMDARFAEVNATMDARFAEVQATMDARFAEVHAKLDLLKSDLNGRIDERIGTVKFDILKWSFVFWATMLIALVMRTR